MTTIYVHKTIVTCAQCSTDWIFPTNTACPSCGDGIVFRAAGDTEPAHDPGATTIVGPPRTQTMGGTPQDQIPQGRGHEPDGFSKYLVYIGMALCVAIIICTYWHSLAFDPMLAYLDLPAVVWPFVRYLALAVAAFGIFQGTISLIFWKSGYHFYRRFRY